MGEMVSEIIEITPELAKEYLEANMEENRNIQVATVQGYAMMMRLGKWNLTHQGIAFDESGKLIDGQHRLKAVILANVPVKMMVTRNVQRKPGEAFTIDTGRRRTFGNIAQISGISDKVYSAMGGTIGNYMRWKMPGANKADPATIMDYIARHYVEIKALYEMTLPNTHTRRGETTRIPAFLGAAMLAALYRGEDKTALESFARVYRLSDVSDCEKYNPRHALNLREFMRNRRASAESFNRCESAIWAFCHNRAALHIRDNCYPYNDALDR